MNISTHPSYRRKYNLMNYYKKQCYRLRMKNSLLKDKNLMLERRLRENGNGEDVNEWKKKYAIAKWNSYTPEEKESLVIEGVLNQHAS